jgi:hypothetical protein
LTDIMFKYNLKNFNEIIVENLKDMILKLMKRN